MHYITDGIRLFQLDACADEKYGGDQRGNTYIMHEWNVSLQAL